MDKLVDAVTRVIMEKLRADGQPVETGGCDGKSVVMFGQVPDDLVCPGYTVKCGTSCADITGCDYIVMTRESFNAIHGGASSPVAAAPAAACSSCGGQVIDLAGKRLIHERDLRDHNAQNGDVVVVGKNAIITALAHDYAKGIGVKIQKG